MNKSFFALISITYLMLVGSSMAMSSEGGLLKAELSNSGFSSISEPRSNSYSSDSISTEDSSNLEQKPAQVLKKLKVFLKDYAKKKDTPDWLIQFKDFLTAKIVDSPQRKEIIEAACEPWRSTFYQDCITGSLGFGHSVDGLRNTINVIKDTCHFKEEEGSCTYYYKMLNQDTSQLKFIMQIK